MEEIRIIEEEPSRTVNKTTAAKKTATAKKKTSSANKTSSSGSMKLSAAEKTLIRNYRKCNVLEKKLLQALAEKAAGQVLDISALVTTVLQNLLKAQ